MCHVSCHVGCGSCDMMDGRRLVHESDRLDRLVSQYRNLVRVRPITVMLSRSNARPGSTYFWVPLRQSCTSPWIRKVCCMDPSSDPRGAHVLRRPAVLRFIQQAFMRTKNMTRELTSQLLTPTARAALGVTNPWVGASATTRVTARNIIAVFRTQAARLFFVASSSSARRDVEYRGGLQYEGFSSSGNNSWGFDFGGVLVLRYQVADSFPPAKLASQPKASSQQ